MMPVDKKTISSYIPITIFQFQLQRLFQIITIVAISSCSGIKSVIYNCYQNGSHFENNNGEEECTVGPSTPDVRYTKQTKAYFIHWMSPTPEPHIRGQLVWVCKACPVYEVA